MPNELNPAEQAAAEMLSRIHNRRVDISQESEPADHADEARAVVAAVRGPLWRELGDRVREDWPRSAQYWDKLYRMADEVEGHGPDWSGSLPGEGPSCACGYNGSPRECRARRELDRAAERQAEGSTE